MQPVTLEYAFTPELNQRCQALHTTQSQAGTAYLLAIHRVLPIAGALGIVIALALSTLPLHRLASAETATVAGGMLVLSAALSGMYARRKRIAYRKSAASNVSGHIVRVTLAEDTVTVPTKAGARPIPWTSIRRIVDDKTLWLLYLTENNFIAIPLSAIDLSRRNEVRDLLKRRAKHA